MFEAQILFDTIVILRPWAVAVLIVLWGVLATNAYLTTARDETIVQIKSDFLPFLKHEPEQRLRKNKLWVWFWSFVLCWVIAGVCWRPISGSDSIAPKAKAVLVLEVTEEMEAGGEVSRLQAAKIKIKTYIKNYPGNELALVAFNGSAHLVMPLTEDPEAILYFLDALSSEIFPIQGFEQQTALDVASELIAGSASRAGILMLTSRIESKALETSVPLEVLWYGNPSEAPSGWGMNVYLPKPDHSSLEDIQDNLETMAVLDAAEGRWQEDFYWLLPFLILGMAFFFRKNWRADYV
jgi:heme/copper-type cytochrome/quinol oxidase subunit 4